MTEEQLETYRSLLEGAIAFLRISINKKKTKNSEVLC